MLWMKQYSESHSTPLVIWYSRVRHIDADVQALYGRNYTELQHLWAAGVLCMLLKNGDTEQGEANGAMGTMTSSTTTTRLDSRYMHCWLLGEVVKPSWSRALTRLLWC